MKSKKVLFAITLIVLMISLVGCSLISKPRETVNTLFKALKTYDTQLIESIVTEFPNTDDCGVTYDLFSDEAYQELYRTAYGDLSFKVKSVSEDESSATIDLEVTHPDLKAAYTNALYSSAAMLMSNEELFEEFMANPDLDVSYLVPQQIKNQYSSGNIKNVTSTFTLKLTQSDGEWKIVAEDNLKNLISSNLYSIASTINDQKAN